MTPILDYHAPTRSERLAAILRVACRWLIRIVLACLSLVALGYLSNFASAHACENHAASWAVGTMSGHPFHSQTPEVFRRIGVATLPDPFNTPWAYVKPTRCRLPFLSSVEFGVMYAPLDGFGGTIRYFTFFGFAIPLGDPTMTWVS